MGSKQVFGIELQCSYDEWWRYNVALQCGAFDEQDERIGFSSLRQTIAEVGANLQVAPEKGCYTRKLTLESTPCHHARFLIYIMPHTLPTENRLEQTPPFNVKIRTLCNGKEIDNEKRAVNQWSGTSIEIELKA